MVKRQEIIDLFVEIRGININPASDSLPDNAISLGKAKMRNSVLEIIQMRFFSLNAEEAKR